MRVLPPSLEDNREQVDGERVSRRAGAMPVTLITIMMRERMMMMK